MNIKLKLTIPLIVFSKDYKKKKKKKSYQYKKKLRYILHHHHATSVWWSLYKYKCIWGVEGKGRGLSFRERVSQTYTLRLGYSINFILYPPTKKKKERYILHHIFN